MKKYRGFSIFELFLFICIAGILIFLAFPFYKSFFFPSKSNSAKIIPIVSIDDPESNHSYQANNLDANQTDSFGTSD